MVELDRTSSGNEERQSAKQLLSLATTTNVEVLRMKSNSKSPADRLMVAYNPKAEWEVHTKLAQDLDKRVSDAAKVTLEKLAEINGLTSLEKRLEEAGRIPAEGNHVVLLERTVELVRFLRTEVDQKGNQMAAGK